jgi:glycerate kinase
MQPFGQPRIRMLIPTTPLIVTGSFGPRLTASSVARALARGLQSGGAPAPDVCAIPADLGTPTTSGAVRAGLDALDFDSRMRRARAVILGEWRLQEQTLGGSAAFEIATRARQSGVPAYAVTAENRLDAFDARILDLQAILTAGSPRALAAAGRELARLI